MAGSDRVVKGVKVRAAYEDPQANSHGHVDSHFHLMIKRFQDPIPDL